ncbi:hypothetical protein Tco_1439201 [Tanacetum coccineum]
MSWFTVTPIERTKKRRISSDADTTSYPELLLTCPDQQQTLLDTAPYMSRGDIAPYMSRTDTTPYMSTLLLTCHGQLLTC